jgi:hypothetical protein
LGEELTPQNVPLQRPGNIFVLVKATTIPALINIVILMS